MKRFNYKAKDSLGRVVTGEVEAPDIHQAARLVKGKSLYVISITAKIDSPFSIIRDYGKESPRVTYPPLPGSFRQ